jgi:predicted Zn-dependent protease
MTTLSMQFMLGGDQTIGAETTELLVHLRYGRRQESRADLGALARLERAEVSPAGMATFFERLSQNRDGPMPEILSSHPESESRARIARSHAEKYKSTLLLDKKEWKPLQSGCS